MCSILRGFLAVLLTVRSSSSTDPARTDADERWVTRPPPSKKYTSTVYIVMSNKADDGTCSGSVIGKRMQWVLTAARCLYKGGKLVETNTSLTVYGWVDKSGTGQEKKSKRVIVHDIPGKDSYFSIALVELESPFEREFKNRTMKPLQLRYGFPRLTGEVCRSGSYGRFDWKKKEEPPTLKNRNNFIVSCSCARSLQEAFPKASTHQWVCAEFQLNTGLCKGDFGAALKCDITMVAVAINIVTFSDLKQCIISEKMSKECNAPTTVSIYTEVCYHLEWIHSHVPDIPANTTACEQQSSALSLRIDNYWQCVVYFYCFVMFSVSWHSRVYFSVLRPWD